MNQHPDPIAAVVARERGRTRMRMVTITVGAAALATTGVVAYILPGAAHKTSATANTGSTAQPATQPTTSQPAGDDGQTVTIPAGGTAAHTTSGGS